ncbi:MAG: putative DNA-binding domain-containing protein [Pseudomonas sp.]|nr:putative DNA-binding domain-containing protein [Pseudomonas sp.]
MSSLATMQSQMIASLVAEDADLSQCWSEQQQAGLAVYRNNYRTATIGALQNTFERTCRLVGEASFIKAAIHHIIQHPPHSWSLDHVGGGFSSTCAALFRNDPEVSELAWLEWAMHGAFTAPDITPMHVTAFAEATASFESEDWYEMVLRFTPEIVVGVVTHDLIALWQQTAEAPAAEPVGKLNAPHSAVVWREGELPVFRLLADYEAAAMQAMRDGANYGDACEIVLAKCPVDEAAALAGAMLSRWLTDGLVIGIGCYNT